MANSITNVKLGVCNVNFDGNDLGHTKGGVIVRYEQEIRDVTVDEYGSTPAEKVVIGEKLIAECPLAEFSMDNLQIAIPVGSTDASKTLLGGQVGDRLGAVAAELVLHPIANAAGDRTEDVVLYKAVSTANTELSYTVDGERVIPVTFEALIDESRTDGDQLGLIGDSAT